MIKEWLRDPVPRRLRHNAQCRKPALGIIEQRLRRVADRRCRPRGDPIDMPCNEQDRKSFHLSTIPVREKAAHVDDQFRLHLGFRFGPGGEIGCERVVFRTLFNHGADGTANRVADPGEKSLLSVRFCLKLNIQECFDPRFAC
jgi:hypothetical protein